MAQRKQPAEPKIQAEIVEAIAKMYNDTTFVTGGIVELTETHKIFLEALEEKQAEIYKAFDAFKIFVDRIKDNAEKVEVYRGKRYNTLDLSEEEEQRFYTLGEKINAYIDEGKECYKAKYAADKEKLKADAARAIQAERFEDFAVYRAYKLLEIAQEKKKNKDKDAAPDQGQKQKFKKPLRDYDGFKMLDYYLREEIAAPFRDIWEINHKSKEDREEWNKIIDEEKSRIYEKWAKEIPQDELDVTGLVKEKAPEPVKITRVPIINKPDKLKILVSRVSDKLIESNLDFLRLPVDGQLRMFFDTDNEKGRAVEERPGRYKDAWGKTHIDKAVYSRIYMTTEEGVTLDKELLTITDTDITIITHILTLMAYNNFEMTAEQIYQQIFQTKKSIPKSWEDKIDLCFRKFSARRLGVIYEELVKAGMIPETKDNAPDLRKGSREEQVLVYGVETYINKQGRKSKKYVIRDMPFIYIYSEWRDEILSIDMDLLTAGTREKSNTENAINIRHYLLRRIGNAKRKKAKKTLTPSDTTILIKTLFDKSLTPFEIIDKGNGRREVKPIEISRKQKQEALDIVEAILNELKDRKEIKDYEIPRAKKGKGNPYEKIIIKI